MAERWNNWSGRLEAEPSRLHFLRSEADAVAVAAAARSDGHTVRAVGAGHSHMPLVPTDGVIVDTSGLSGVITVDADALIAEVWGGTPIHALGRPLHDAGVALHNQGDIDRQSIAGAVGTGTHGTGATLGSMSTAVIGATIATPEGIVRCSAETEPDLWRAAQLHLGALGLVTRVDLAVVPAYRLREVGSRTAGQDMLDQLAEVATASRHFEFFWFPTADLAVAKATDITNDAPEYPLAAEGERCAWNYEVLPNHRDWRHTEMEYAIPADRGPECFAEVRRLFLTEFSEVRWPVEYRTVAADDLWLSPAGGRATVTISVHMDVNENDGPLFDACEAIFRNHDGRPHWGKVNSFTADEFVGAYPMWERWWEVRDRVDPADAFVNEWLASVRPR